MQCCELDINRVQHQGARSGCQHPLLGSIFVIFLLCDDCFVTQRSFSFDLFFFLARRLYWCGIRHNNELYAFGLVCTRGYVVLLMQHLFRHWRSSSQETATKPSPCTGTETCRLEWQNTHALYLPVTNTTQPIQVFCVALLPANSAVRPVCRTATE